MLRGGEDEALAFWASVSATASGFAAEPSLPAKCLRMLFHEVENNTSKLYLDSVFKMKNARMPKSPPRESVLLIVRKCSSMEGHL